MKSKLLKNAVSYVLTFMIVFGTAIVGINAATTDETQTSENENYIYFDLNSAGWTDTQTVFCHIWATDGSGVWPSWQGKAEQCTYNAETGIATYNLSKTGHNIQPDDGKIYSVIFSTNTGMQTYNCIMNGACIDDTAYCTGNLIENPMDSSKTAYETAWRKNTNCGPQKQITTSGNIIGSVHADGSNDDSMLADFLISHYDDNAILSQLDVIMPQLSVFASSVMHTVTIKEDADVAHGKKTQEQIEIEIEAIQLALDTYAPVPSTDPEMEYPDINQIGLKLKDSPWADATDVYCHIFNAETGKVVTTWQSAREKMTIKNGMAVYDIKNAGLGIDYVSDTEYGVIFSNNYGSLTYTMTLGAACLGDYVNLNENPWIEPTDDKSVPYIGRWNLNNVCGTHFSIDTTGTGFGAYLYDFENAYDLAENYLINSCIESSDVSFNALKMQNILDSLEIDISVLLEDIEKQLNLKLLADEINAEQQSAILAKITEVLNACENPASHKNIYLDTSACTYETAWSSDKIYCHICKVDKTGKNLDFQSEEEICNYNYFTGIASYCLDKTNFDFAPSDTKAYYVTFSDSSQKITYTMVMDGSCIGDMVDLSGFCDEIAVNGAVFYNAHWEDSRTCGQLKQIKGNEVNGKVLPTGQTDEMIFSKYLIDNNGDNTVINIYNVQSIYDQLDVSMAALKVQLDKDLTGNKDKEAILNSINAVLNNVDTSDQRIFGDLNGDYLLTVEDATIEQRILAGINGYVYLGQEAMADVNRDGYVTVEDTTLIQRIAGEVE